MKITRENIESFIPQRPPFVMIDNLINATQTELESDFTVRTENIFLKKQILQEPALIENIAQTCAAGFGFLMNQMEGEPKLGFIGAISKLEVHSLPGLHSKINTLVTVTYKLDNIYVVKGENYCSGKKLLECEMKIVLTGK